MQALLIIEVLELHVLHIEISVSSKAIIKNCSEFEALQQASEPSTPKASPHQKRGSGSKYEHMSMFLVDRYDARISFDTMIVAIHG
jgi:hypothetical protein